MTRHILVLCSLVSYGNKKAACLLPFVALHGSKIPKHSLHSFLLQTSISFKQKTDVCLHQSLWCRLNLEREEQIWGGKQEGEETERRARFVQSLNQIWFEFSGSHSSFLGDQLQGISNWGPVVIDGEGEAVRLLPSGLENAQSPTLASPIDALNPNCTQSAKKTEGTSFD